MSVRYELIDEFRITTGLHEQIRCLLQVCFPDSEFTLTRSYSKQSPQRRLLVWEDGILIGHVGIEHRTIGLDTGPATIFGLLEVCVDPEHQGTGIASGMIDYVERLGQQHDVDFVMLFATDRRLYEQKGFRAPGNPLRWSMIHEHKTIGIDEQPLEELMIKELGERPWPEGLVDLLGYQF
jgi:predicted N-acetyltransferase YhbS